MYTPSFRSVLGTIACVLLTFNSAGQLRYDGGILRNFGTSVQYFEDAGGELELNQVLILNEFKAMPSEIPNLGISESAHWLTFDISNATREPLVLEINYPILDDVQFFLLDEKSKLLDSMAIGEAYPFSVRTYSHQNLIFPIDLEDAQRGKVVLRVTSGEQIVLPMRVAPMETLRERFYREDLLFGLYAGIVIVMILYNGFIYFSTRDRSYLEYILYIFLVGSVQLILKGYAFKYIWPNSPGVALQAVYWSGALSGIGVAIFVRSFLRTREYAMWFDYVLRILIFLDVVSIVLAAMGYFNASYNLINLVAGPGALVLLIAAYIIYKKGLTSAKFFLIAWSIFLISVIVYVLKDYSILPYNDITSNILQAGSAAEIILLSLALADRINTLKKETEESRERELVALQENERIIKQQNITLEQKVKERTDELEQANDELQTAMSTLKNAQAQLVNAEKMASLGQLTAGIAHEINNPINFVASNVTPLRKDIDDLLTVLKGYDNAVNGEAVKENIAEVTKLKEDLDIEFVIEEIDQLLVGIRDGASRTAEIVKGLKNFSRVDEMEYKKADIHEGLDSTLIILRNQLKDIVEVERNYDENLTEIECYPGKLNQVFANIIANAGQALMEYEQEERKVMITTENLDTTIKITIADNGPGIPKDVQEKVFEPFFTTKEVGEGTGLGLSIVYSIIESHDGTIKLESEPGKGAAFIIELPKKRNVTKDR